MSGHYLRHRQLSARVLSASQAAECEGIICAPRRFSTGLLQCRIPQFDARLQHYTVDQMKLETAEFQILRLPQKLKTLPEWQKKVPTVKQIHVS